MSELISGKEALSQVYSGRVQYMHSSETQDRWTTITDHYYPQYHLGMFLDEDSEFKFRLKPRTIALNGIEVPINRKKNDKDQVVWIINTSCESWYDWVYGSDCDSDTLYWDSEEEIKQVVAALREVFK